MVLLPVEPGLARYTFQCELDKVSFNFAFEWNDRDSGWYMSINDVNGVPLLSGRRVVLNYPLINLYRDTALPLGNIMAFDSTGSDTEPGYSDLGDRVYLAYTPYAELVNGL